MGKRGLRLNIVMCITLIDALFKGGRIVEAASLVEETYHNGWESRGEMGLLEDMSKSGLKPNVITYTTLINRFCKINNASSASAVSREMRKRGCFSNIVTYNALIDGLSNAGRKEEAVALLDEMHQSGLYQDVVTNNTLVYGLCKAHKVKGAFVLCKEMRKRGCYPDLLRIIRS
ncbi:hypothetical protein AMTR_s00122p00003330 [Amborella trichopoda]|uniref:Pentacotripeptide-repeat region of PRORP domain-containing protein n=1 Tax=Amborella trichopoda TaxID=13333 RepID=W1NN62_AMBTC|nr:hypothetical protein AMTR_s00122p00003330 [Amborella trichopoda]